MTDVAKRWAARIASWAWNTLALGAALAIVFNIGQHAGYGRGARDIAALIHELRQGPVETPEPWTRGGI